MVGFRCSSNYIEHGQYVLIGPRARGLDSLTAAPIFDSHRWDGEDASPHFPSIELHFRTQAEYNESFYYLGWVVQADGIHA